MYLPALPCRGGVANCQTKRLTTPCKAEQAKTRVFFSIYQFKGMRRRTDWQSKIKSCHTSLSHYRRLPCHAAPHCTAPQFS